MRIFISDYKEPTKMPPLGELHRILNKEECGVSRIAVSNRTGKLVYKNKGDGLFTWHDDVVDVKFFRVEKHPEMCKEFNYLYDFDMILSDGRVIEVRTWVKSCVASALKTAKPYDPREGRRTPRGVQR